MCVEDIIQGMHRRSKFTGSNSTDITIPSDPRRLAITFLCNQNDLSSFATVFLGSSADNAKTVCDLNCNSPRQLFRIEDYGEFVTGGFFIRRNAVSSISVIETYIIEPVNDMRKP